MPNVLGARLGRFFVVVCVVESVGLRRARTQCGATALLLLPCRFLVHFPSSYYVVIIAHAHAARCDVTRWAVTTAIETVAVIATGGRPIARRAATSGGVHRKSVLKKLGNSYGTRHAER